MKRFMASIFCISTLLLNTSFGHASSKHVFGWVEEGQILPERIAVKMKFDTGALTSSMDAKDIVKFEKGGEPWVRFNVELLDVDTDKIVKESFERPVIQRVKVRGAGGIDHRYVVTMDICIGTEKYEGPFTLNNRKNMLYPVLLGRKALEKIGPVDVTRTFTMEPNCR